MSAVSTGETESWRAFAAKALANRSFLLGLVITALIALMAAVSFL